MSPERGYAIFRRPREGFGGPNMRTFTLILICLALGTLTGCPSTDDTHCGSTTGCMPPPDNCGDEACQANEGENAQNCPEDCVPATCGDGMCAGAETPANCSADCNVTCVANSQEPVYCADTNSCWPAGTDCNLPSYECQGVLDDNRPTTGRCLPEQGEDQIDSQVSCCGGVYHDCPSSRPQWCPAQSACVADGACPSAATDCELPRLDCRTN